jgi:Protein of unknown function (DUF2934)
VESHPDDTYSDDAPTFIGRRSRGNEDLTVVDLGPSDPTAGSSDSVDAPPTYDEIAAEAYAIYESRGGQHGQDTNDWLEAERRLRERAGSRE